MNIGELIAFLTGVKEEFGDIKVKLHITAAQTLTLSEKNL